MGVTRRYRERAQQEGLEALTAEVKALKEALQPKKKPPLYKRVGTWVATGLVGLVGSAFFALPDDLKITHLYTLRGFQKQLAQYKTFVPDRCEEVVPVYRSLALETQRADLEFAHIHQQLGRCFQELANSPGAADRHKTLHEARRAYAAAAATYDEYHRESAGEEKREEETYNTFPRKVAALLQARRTYTEEEYAETQVRLAEIHRQLTGYEDIEGHLREAQHILEDVLVRDHTNVAALNNMGNILSHLNILASSENLSTRRDSDIREERLAVLEAGRENYEKALLHATNEKARTFININLGIQYLVLASEMAPFFRINEEPEPITFSRKKDPKVFLDKASEAFQISQKIGNNEITKPLTGLLQPNFAILYRGIGQDVNIRYTDTGELTSEKRMFWDPKDMSGKRESMVSHLQGAEDLYDIRGVIFDGFGIEVELVLALAITEYRNFQNFLEKEKQEGEQYPREYSVALAKRGVAEMELSLLRDRATLLERSVQTLRDAYSILGEIHGLAAVDLDEGTFYSTDAIEEILEVQQREKIDMLFPLYNLWNAQLHMASVRDTTYMLRKALNVNLLAALDDPQIDQALVAHTTALTLALTAYVGSPTLEYENRAAMLREAIVQTKSVETAYKQRFFSSGEMIVRGSI